jgi:predicted RNA-binding Zn ribbon-like protein
MLSDDLALELLNSVFTPKDELVDRIADGRGLAAWMGVKEELAGDWDLAAAEARELREWLRGVLPDFKAGRGVDVQRLNELLRRGSSYEEVVVEEGFQMLWRQRRREVGDWLLPLAAAAGRLLCEAERERVKRCENPACTLWFYDRTKAQRRRWCSTAVCGNRAKVAAFRARRAAGG